MFRGNEKANVDIESLNGYKAISDYGIIGTCQESRSCRAIRFNRLVLFS